jgi:hypothetical protein
MSHRFFNIICSLFMSLSCSTINTRAMMKPPVPEMSSVAKPPAPKISSRLTVVHYFLEIPAKYLIGPGKNPITTRQRQQMLANAKTGKSNGIYDVNNGYLQMFRESDLCPMHTIAIFKRSTASPLVALNISCTVGDSLVILDPDRNWQDVTPKVLPADLSPSHDAAYMVTVVPPRSGKTIEIYHEDDNNKKTSIGRYRFNGQQFRQN